MRVIFQIDDFNQKLPDKFGIKYRHYEICVIIFSPQVKIGLIQILRIWGNWVMQEKK